MLPSGRDPREAQPDSHPPHATPTVDSGGTDATGSFVDLDHDRYAVIRGTSALAPFFMTVAGASDMWLFLSSGGGVTAGRRNASHAVFPYSTDDKIVDTAASSGGLTLVRATLADGSSTLWQPFEPSVDSRGSGTRSVYRSVWGDHVVLEDRHDELGLVMRVGWRTSGRFGVVRECTLLANEDVVVDVLDGVQNVLPPGVTPQTQNALSNLLDAYKRAEVDPASGVAAVFLSSLLTDRAEPAESLSATTVWHTGLPGATVSTDLERARSFARGEPAVPVSHTRGRRGAYLLEARGRVTPGEPLTWATLVDTDQSAADVVDLVDLARDQHRASAAVAQDRLAGRDALRRHLSAADGLQKTGDEVASVHHRANVLFNAMRGGVPPDGYAVDAADVRAFVTERSTATAARLADELRDLPTALTGRALIEWADAVGDVDLCRLAREYLPLTFSRRHGDPSRPWNVFDIVVKAADGAPRLDHQGNWRDIFQNWEALAWSYPELAENMVTVFLDATTIDGYNPYRISRAGIDWEVPAPDDPWSNIGYWSDHQVIYLLKLIETVQRFHPGRVESLLDRAIFTHADVPYSIRDYDEIVEDPFDTIEFDAARDARSRAAVAAEGGDALLRHDAAGELVRATMGEKLLLILAAKMVNFVPGAGIWMTTQRPEWNDANNALVGRGTSLVTVAYLRRFVLALDDLLDDAFELSTRAADARAGPRRSAPQPPDAGGAGRRRRRRTGPETSHHGRPRCRRHDLPPSRGPGDPGRSHEGDSRRGPRVPRGGARPPRGVPDGESSPGRALRLLHLGAPERGSSGRRSPRGDARGAGVHALERAPRRRGVARPAALPPREQAVPRATRTATSCIRTRTSLRSSVATPSPPRPCAPHRCWSGWQAPTAGAWSSATAEVGCISPRVSPMPTT